MSVEKKIIKPAEKEFGEELGNYWIGPTFSAQKIIQRMTDRYKRNFLKKMIALDPREIDPAKQYKKYKSLPEDLIVTVKRDGGYYLYYYDDHTEPLSIFCNSPNGRAIYNLPVTREIENRIKDLNTSSLDALKSKLLNFTGKNLFESHDTICKIVLAGELFANIVKPEDRPRVFDLINLLRSPEKLEDLDHISYDVFDIIAINDVELTDMLYERRLELVDFLFPRNNDNKAKTIEYRKDVKPADVYKLYGRWVEKERQEGLIIHTKFNMIYKIKSVFELDAVIIGYVEMLEEKTLEKEGAISSVLLALMRPDGTYQELCRMGGGFSYEQRVELFNLIKDDLIDSAFRASKGDGRAYHFVKPKYIVQMKYMDIVTEGALGEPVRRMALRFEDDKWVPIRSVPFVSVISPRFDMMRSIIDKEKYPSLDYVNPKKVTYEDLKIDQVLDLIPIDTPASVQELENLPKSKILLKVVFQGKWGGVLSAHKIILWATNKRDLNRTYPDYILYDANYSHLRAKPLEQDIYPFNTFEKAIAHLNWIFERPDNPTKGLLDKSGTKLKGSLLTPPYKFIVDEEKKTEIAKNLSSVVRNILFEKVAIDKLLEEILSMDNKPSVKKAGKKAGKKFSKKDVLDELLDVNLDDIDFSDL